MIIAACYANQNATGSDVSLLGGPLGPLSDGTGWEWRYAGWVADTTSTQRISVETRTVTLNTDSLAQVRSKILAGIKAAAQEHNMTPTIAIFDPMAAPITIP